MCRKLHTLAFFVAATSLTTFTAQAQVPDAGAGRDDMIALGMGFDTAETLYEHLVEEADGGSGITYRSMPDWSGLWTVDLSKGFAFDGDGPRGDVSAQLTPEYRQRYEEKVALVNQGIEYDPLGDCDPPGVPRWFQEPFQREFVVTPDQTWLLNEVANEIRRIYTDGRGHLHPLDRFPTYDGDSIGFWDNDKLVIHTNQLKAGQYQRNQPDYSEEIELVEIWQKVDDETISVHVWAYDPIALEAPWYANKTYLKLSNEDKYIRIHYWACNENQNNAVIETEEGATDFSDFDFTSEDDK